MKKMILRLHRDENGSVFVEMALLIIGVVLVVATHMNGLGSSLGDKIDEIKTEVEQVGI